MAGSCIVAAPTLPTNALDKSSGELYGVIDFPAVGSLGRLGAAWSRAHKFGFDLAPSDGGKQLARQLEFVFDDTRCPRSVLLDDLYLQVGPCSILLSSSTLQYEKYLVPSSSIAEYAAAEAANGWSRISWLSSGAALLRLPVRALVLPVALALLPSAASRTACTIPTHLTTTTTTLHPPNAASSVADPTTPAITIAHYQRQGKLLCAHPCCLIRPQYVVHGSLSWGRGKKGRERTACTSCWISLGLRCYLLVGWRGWGTMWRDAASCGRSTKGAARNASANPSRTRSIWRRAWSGWRRGRDCSRLLLEFPSRRRRKTLDTLIMASARVRRDKCRAPRSAFEEAGTEKGRRGGGADG